MALPREELREHLQHHIEFLELSAWAFDAGKVAEAKRMATSLRVLLHDTPRSHSLLGQLINLNEHRFPCVNIDPPLPGSIISIGGMYEWRVGSLVAKTQMSTRSEPFPVWWAEIVNRRDDIAVSRASAVGSLANKGGGAHVDPRLDTDYRRIAVDHHFGIHLEPNDGKDPLDNDMNDVLPYIVRATAAEVLAFLRVNPI